MKVLINDILPTVHNMYGTNGELFKLVKHFYDEVILILWIVNVTEPTSMENYVGGEYFTRFHWEKHFSFLNKHKIMVCNKEHVIDLISSADDIYQFSSQENLISVKSTVFVNPLDDFLHHNQLTYKSVYTAISGGEKLSLYTSSIVYNLPIQKNDQFTIFIHCIDCDVNKLDKVLLGLKGIENVKVVLYNPVYEYVDRQAKLSEFNRVDDKLIMTIGNTNVEFNLPENLESIDKKTIVNYRIKTASDVLSLNPVQWDMFLKYCGCDYTILDHFFENDNELFSHITSCDIYIPIGNEFSSLYLFSQKNMAYTLFLTDEQVYKEYCLYGKVLGVDHEDYQFNMKTNRVEKVVRAQEVQSAILEYMANKTNFAFQYPREIASILF